MAKKKRSVKKGNRSRRPGAVSQKDVKRASRDSLSEENNSKFFAFVATFFSIIGFVIALIFKRDDDYVMHYAAQSLVVFIIAVVASIIGGILGWIPILGWVIDAALWILVTLLWIFSWVYALSGERKEVPLFGEWGRKFRL